MGRTANPGINDRKIQCNSAGRYRVSCGYIRNTKGERKAFVADLGTDEKVARVKRDLLRAEFRKVKAEGHDVWPAEVLLRMADQQIIGSHAAASNARKVMQGEMIDLARTKTSTTVTATYELNKFKNGMGQVKADAFGDYAFALLRGEVLDAEGETLVRKAIKQLMKSDPLAAFKMTVDLWKMLEERRGEGAQVNVNITGTVARDDSERRAIEIETIMGEQIVDVSGIDSCSGNQ